MQLPTDSSSTLILSGEHAYSPGQFLAAAPEAGTPDGFLLKVISSTTAGGETEVLTEPGSLYEAVPNGEIDTGLGDLSSATPANADARRLARAIHRDSSGQAAPVTPFDKQVTCKDEAKLTLKGSLTTSIAPHLLMKWHKFFGVPVGINKAKASLDASVEAEAEGTVSAKDTCTLTPITLFDPEWETVVLVGGVPVPVTVDVPIELTGSAGVSGSVSVKATAEAHGSLGVAYENDELSGIHEFSSDAGLDQTVKAQASLEARIGPNATITAGWEIKHLGGVAAQIGVKATTGVRLAYETAKSPPGSLCAPLTVTGSVALDLPFKTIEKTAKIYDGDIKCIHWGEAGPSEGWSGIVTAEFHDQFDIEHPGETIQHTTTDEHVTMTLDGSAEAVSVDEESGSRYSLQHFSWAAEVTETISVFDPPSFHGLYLEEGSGSGSPSSQYDVYGVTVTPLGEDQAEIYLDFSQCSGCQAYEPLTITTNYTEEQTNEEPREGTHTRSASLPGENPYEGFSPEFESVDLRGPYVSTRDGSLMTIEGEHQYQYENEGEGEGREASAGYVNMTWRLTRLPDQNHDGTPDS